jgi:hypothetical protein
MIHESTTTALRQLSCGKPSALESLLRLVTTAAAMAHLHTRERAHPGKHGDAGSRIARGLHAQRTGGPLRTPHVCHRTACGLQSAGLPRESVSRQEQVSATLWLSRNPPCDLERSHNHLQPITKSASVASEAQQDAEAEGDEHRNSANCGTSARARGYILRQGQAQSAHTPSTQAALACIHVVTDGRAIRCGSLDEALHFYACVSG